MRSLSAVRGNKSALQGVRCLGRQQKRMNAMDIMHEIVSNSLPLPLSLFRHTLFYGCALFSVLRTNDLSLLQLRLLQVTRLGQQPLHSSRGGSQRQAFFNTPPLVEKYQRRTGPSSFRRKYCLGKPLLPLLIRL